MYFLGTIHPDLEETKKEGYIGVFLTLDQKKHNIDEFNKGRRTAGIGGKELRPLINIPFTIEHKSRKELGSVILPSDRVGKTTDLLLDNKGNIVVKGIVDKDTVVYNDLKYGKTEEERKWGLSLRIDATFKEIKDEKTGNIIGIDSIKRITHIAFTKTPYFADKNTYIHHCSEKEELIDKTIQKYYYKENDGYCYISNDSPLKTKIKELETQAQGSIHYYSLFYFILNYEL